MKLYVEIGKLITSCSWGERDKVLTTSLVNPSTQPLTENGRGLGRGSGDSKRSRNNDNVQKILNYSKNVFTFLKLITALE